MEGTALELFKRLFGQSTRKSRSPRKTAAKRRRAKPARAKRSQGRRWPWALAVAVVVVVVGVGLLNWTRTRHGQATLLTLGSDKMYGEVQSAVDAVLVAALPGFAGGVAVDPADHDWPAPSLGPGALIRCRRITVPAGESWWEIQARIAAVVADVGARVLWGERLLPARLGNDQLSASEEWDLLRLDIGVAGRPTHTLVLARAGVRSPVQWGGGSGLTRWTEFAGEAAPTVALIIDDWGHGKTAAARSILALPAAVTMAVLPDLPYSRYFSLQSTDLILPPGWAVAVETGDSMANSRQARLQAGCIVEVSTGWRRSARLRKRREIMLHLPMQPQGYPETNPGPNPLLVGMDQAEIRVRLDNALASLTNVTGLNNHMGSAATSDTPTMRALMSVLQKRDLFFVDSLTSANSVAYAEAVRAGIPAARNRIFLDYDNENQRAITANLARLVQSARAAGFAVGIGHPHPATAAVLAREIPRLVQEGVRFVTVSELMALRDFQAALAAGTGSN